MIIAGASAYPRVIDFAAFGEIAARSLENSLHLVVPGAHGVSGQCVQSIQREFLERGSVQGLDTSCTSQMKLPPLTLPRPSSGRGEGGERPPGDGGEKPPGERKVY